MSDFDNPPENPSKDSSKNTPKNPWGARKDASSQESDKKENADDQASRASSSKGSFQGNPNQDSIWNKKRQNPADEIIDRLQARLKDIMSGGGRNNNGNRGGRGNGGFNGGSGEQKSNHQGAGVLLLVALVFLGLWLSTGFFRVQEGEVGVVMRFGKMVRTSGPGLRYHFPSPFEDAIVQKVSAVNRIDGGMIGDTKASDAEQALTLTSDENMVIISYSMQWRIKDIGEFLFTARDPEGLIRVAAESAIREVVGQTAARMALTEGREGISNRSQELLQRILDTYKIGVEIISFQLQRVEAPAQVIESFNDVQASLVDAGRLQNEAESYRNQIVPVARGNAEQITQNAKAYAQKHIAEAEGEVSRIHLVYKAYQHDPKFAIARLHMATMQRVLKNASSKVIMDGKAGKDVVPYLPLNDLKKVSSGKNEDSNENDASLTSASSQNKTSSNSSSALSALLTPSKAEKK